MSLVIVVQSLSYIQLFVTPWTAAHQASLSITNSQSLLKLMSIESMMPSNNLILCHPLLLPPSFFPSIRGNELVLHIRWPMYWSFSISPSSEYSRLISFRIDCFDLLAVLTRWHCRKYVCSWTHQPSFLFVHDLTIFFLKSKAPVIFLALLFFFERREELAITVCVYIPSFMRLPLPTHLLAPGSSGWAAHVRCFTHGVYVSVLLSQLGCPLLDFYAAIIFS